MLSIKHIYIYIFCLAILVLPSDRVDMRNQFFLFKITVRVVVFVIPIVQINKTDRIWMN